MSATAEMNMFSVTVEEFTKELEMQMDEENYDPMLGLGKSGVGKTMSIAELCKKKNIGFCELRLVTMNEIDLLGLPKETPDGRTTYASNDLLPDAKRDGEVGILVLDEITSATSTIRAAAYQLLDSKRALGNYKLPPHWKVVALGNGMSDGGVFSGLESAFISRCISYRIEPDIDCWKHWAVENGVNPSVIAFLSFDRSWFHKMDPDEIATVFPCPRSWTALSKILNAREARKGGTLDEAQVRMLAAGAVGFEASTPFATFYRFNDSVTINPDDIVDGKGIKESGEFGHRKFKVDIDIANMEQQTMYITIQSISKALSDATKNYSIINSDEENLKYLNKVANVVKFFLAIGDVRKDYMITGMQELIANIPNISPMLIDDDLDAILPEYGEFANNASVIFKKQA